MEEIVRSKKKNYHQNRKAAEHSENLIRYGKTL